LNGLAPPPAIGDVPKKLRSTGSEPSTSDDEQPTSPLRCTKAGSDDGEGPAQLSAMVAGDDAAAYSRQNSLEESV
jgi:hypothetical protein